VLIFRRARIGSGGVRRGSLVSPAPSSAFPCCQVRPRGCRSPSAVRPEGRPREPPHLRSSSEPYRSSWPILSAFSLGFPSACPSHVSPELRLSPLHRRAREPSTPATTASRRFGSGGATLEVPFRPRGFSPPRRFPPVCAVRACCIPLPILGSTAFPLVGVPVRRPRPSAASPQCRSVPLEELLVDSRNASPRPLPPCRSLPDHRLASPVSLAVRRSVAVGGSGASASRPCSIAESGVVPRRCRWVDDPLLPGLRSISRSCFAAAGDPVSHRGTSAVARPGRPGWVSHEGSSVPHLNTAEAGQASSRAEARSDGDHTR